MVTLISLVGAILPAVLLIGYFTHLDRKRPEPKGLIRKAVILGFVAVVPAMILELSLDYFLPNLGQVEDAFIRGFLVASLVEEGVKFVFVAIWLFSMPQFDEIADGIVYTVCLSLGFALVENVMYSLNSPLTMVVRAFTAVPMHAAASGVMGYFIGRARMGKRNYQLIGLGWAVFLHGIYDFFAFLGNGLGWLIIPVVVIGFMAVYRLFKRAVAMDDHAAIARRLVE